MIFSLSYSIDHKKYEDHDCTESYIKVMVITSKWATCNFWSVQIFKVAQKSGQRPCTIVQGLWSNFAKNEKERILNFYYIF